MTTLEIHCTGDPAFTSSGLGRRVRAVGGEYSQARGHSRTRYVRIPLTREAIPVADEVIQRYGTGGQRSNEATVIIHTGPRHVYQVNGGSPHWPTHVEVQYVARSSESPTMDAVVARARSIRNYVARHRPPTAEAVREARRRAAVGDADSFDGLTPEDALEAIEGVVTRSMLPTGSARCKLAAIRGLLGAVERRDRLEEGGAL